jgi:hypothetical protein
MKTIRVNRDNHKVDEFKVVKDIEFLDKVNELYLEISPDVSRLMRILKTVFSQVILCPDNGAFRCVAIWDGGNSQAGMFFPLIFPEDKSSSQKIVYYWHFG